MWLATDIKGRQWLFFHKPFRFNSNWHTFYPFDKRRYEDKNYMMKFSEEPMKVEIMASMKPISL